MKIIVVILAAGSGSRFQGIKQLTLINDQPMLTRTLEIFEQADIGHVCVTIGAYAEYIKQVVPSNIQIIDVAQWQQGLSRSIKAAVVSLPSDCTHLCIGLADQVAVCIEDIQRLVKIAAQSPNKIVASKYAAIIGVPAIFPQQYFNALLALEGDIGASKLLKQYSHDVISVEMDHGAFDIDTVADLADWQQQE
jgi:molybdenum cofactor cytidylyltransferase